jgi:hypothetical protein
MTQCRGAILFFKYFGRKISFHDIFEQRFEINGNS